MNDRCRWTRDPEIGKFFLPGCMGGAVYGPSGCTCPGAGQERNLKRDRPALEDRVERLEALIDQLTRGDVAASATQTK